MYNTAAVITDFCKNTRRQTGDYITPRTTKIIGKHYFKASDAKRAQWQVADAAWGTRIHVQQIQF